MGTPFNGTWVVMVCSQMRHNHFTVWRSERFFIVNVGGVEQGFRVVAVAVVEV